MYTIIRRTLIKCCTKLQSLAAMYIINIHIHMAIKTNQQKIWKKDKYYKSIHQQQHDNQKSTSTVNAYIITKAFHTQTLSIWWGIFCWKLEWVPSADFEVLAITVRETRATSSANIRKIFRPKVNMALKVRKNHKSY